MKIEIAEKLIRKAAEERYKTVDEKYKWICKDCFIEGALSSLKTISFNDNDMQEAYEAGYNDCRVNKLYTFDEWLQQHENGKFGDELSAPVKK